MAVSNNRMVLTLESGSVIIEEGKKKIKSVYWRLKAEFKCWKKNHRKQNKRFSFQYDPFSYALNFDDGTASRFFS